MNIHKLYELILNKKGLIYCLKLGELQIVIKLLTAEWHNRAINFLL